MSLREDDALLRVFVPEADRFDDRPAWTAVLEHLRLVGLAGATAYRGRAGFVQGGAGGISTDAIEVLAADLPVVVESVDRPERIEAVLEDLAAIVGAKGLVTVERVEVVSRRGGVR